MGRQTDLAFQREDEVIPGPLRLVRDFVNTVEYQEDEEGWEEPSDLSAWLVGRGLLDGDLAASVNADDLALARTLREGLRSVLAGHAGHEVDAAALARLDGALAQMPVRVHLGGPTSFALTPTVEGVPAALSGVLEAVRASHDDGSWSRLKVCDRVTCRWAYYDYSKNRSSRWCTMAGCGNAVKMQKAHERRASTGRSTQ